MQKVLSALAAGLVICSAVPFYVEATEESNEYIYGDGHYETVEEFNDSLNSNLPLDSADSLPDAHLTFDQLLEMNEDELQSYSENFSSIIEEINLSAVYYDCAVYTLNYYDISKYLDSDGLIQKDKLINDIGIPSELIIYLSDVPDTMTVNDVKCDAVKLELSVEDYKDYKAYDVYRAFELILKTNSDIPFVYVEYSGKAYNISPNTASVLAGDVSNDGAFNVSDVVLLQRWLLGVSDTHLDNWKAADYNNDNRLDVFDLCLMKRVLIENNHTNTE